jgi:serine/threonine protein kinase
LLPFLCQTIGKGKFGQIKQLHRSFTPTSEAFKFAKNSLKQKEAELDIKNEYTKLRMIHSKKKVWGIQEPPRQLIKMKGKQRKVLYGHIGTLYERNYKEDLILNPRTKFEDCLTDFHQILAGLKELSQQDILHGDLKVENLLVKEDTDGMKLVHIADFGGAQLAKQEFSLERLAGGAGHRAFSPLTPLMRSSY